MTKLSFVENTKNWPEKALTELVVCDIIPLVTAKAGERPADEWSGT
jgi:hypothetical protein